MTLLERFFGRKKPNPDPIGIAAKARTLPPIDRERFYDAYLSTLNGKDLSHLKFKIAVYQAKLAKVIP